WPLPRFDVPVIEPIPETPITTGCADVVLLLFASLSWTVTVTGEPTVTVEPLTGESVIVELPTVAVPAARVTVASPLVIAVGVPPTSIVAEIVTVPAVVEARRVAV